MANVLLKNTCQTPLRLMNVQQKSTRFYPKIACSALIFSDLLPKKRPRVNGTLGWFDKSY